MVFISTPPYTHPVGIRTRDATEDYMQSRMREADRNWAARNARDEAVALFAGLINEQPTEVAVVPSTLEGENLIAAALGIGPGAGVVTDPFHYDASLVMYGASCRKRTACAQILAVIRGPAQTASSGQ
jgi:selenocysteine lyase/cysteine desulfurase